MTKGVGMTYSVETSSNAISVDRAILGNGAAGGDDKGGGKGI